MSIAFRLKYTLGLIPSADQLDSRWDKLVKMRDELDQMERSDELEKYQKLKELIESSAFKQNQKEVEALQFAGSKEEKLILELLNLSKSASIRNYQKIATSAQLQRLEKILKDSRVTRFQELKSVVESPQFMDRRVSQKKKEYVKSDDFGVLQEFIALKRSDDIRFWMKFSQSDRYKSYLNTLESKDLKRMSELKEITGDTNFEKQVTYLKDKKRFQKSDEYRQILLFKGMDAGKFMAEYRKLKKEKSLDFFNKWEILLEENFSGKELDANKWQPENWLGFQMAGTSFSQEGEMQCYHGAKNIQVTNNVLSLWAKKEVAHGKVWRPTAGLMPKQYDFTSSILNSAAHFRMKEGVVEAKVRFKKDDTIISAFSLTGEKPFPQIDLFRSTKKGIGVGVLEKQGDTTSKYKKINALNDGRFHVYRLELFNNELVWKINGHEIFRNSTSLKEPLFFNLLTSLHGQVNEQLLPHRLEVEWIRCFAQKS